MKKIKEINPNNKLRIMYNYLKLMKSKSYRKTKIEKINKKYD